MSFDPEKVERHQGFLGTQHDSSGDEMWVLASDYDQLLRLYRESCQLLKEASAWVEFDPSGEFTERVNAIILRGI